ncbi:MAG TPA: hypothetical protein VFT43_03610 [Candidatus Polarisedimenticolia bacterium]|nr:hypothetical protein [Candidatus Polarisedimenticolia bacterium]
MKAYALYLGALCGLFGVNSAVLLAVTVAQAARRRGKRAAIYLGLSLLAGAVAAGFYFFRTLVVTAVD